VSAEVHRLTMISSESRVWRISELAAGLSEVRSLGQSGLDLLMLSLVAHDPNLSSSPYALP
jgi:hypothetical protein